jgi:sodium/bile acid cotransporter 7
MSARSATASLRTWVDPFVAALVGTLVLGLLLPVPAGVQSASAVAADVAIVVLFLLYGMRLRTTEVLAGLRNARLQGGILTATYVVFPIVGVAASAAATPIVGPALADGLLFVSLLPSTVQSSVALTSVARGNIAGAITGATVSNVLGMGLTPLLVLAVMGREGTTGIGGIRAVLLQLLLPVAVGQLLQRRTGGWVRAHRPLTLLVDRGTILLVVFAAVTAATAAGVWDTVDGGAVVALAAACLLVLGAVLAATWWGGARLGLDLPDRIALLMCGSKKSLATGLPMAGVLFPVVTAATIAVPLILFHQLQLVVCAIIARRLARRPR